MLQDHVPRLSNRLKVSGTTCFQYSFDDGFETWPRIEIWDLGSTSAARGWVGGGGGGVGKRGGSGGEILIERSPTLAHPQFKLNTPTWLV